MKLSVVLHRAAVPDLPVLPRIVSLTKSVDKNCREYKESCVCKIQRNTNFSFASVIGKILRPRMPPLVRPAKGVTRPPLRRARGWRCGGRGSAPFSTRPGINLGVEAREKTDPQGLQPWGRSMSVESISQESD